MKQAGNETRIIRDENGNPWGLFLAANYTAEHEFGIKNLLRKMNIDPEGRGMEGRSMTAPATIGLAEGSITKTYFIEPKEKGERVTRKKITTKVTFLSTSEYDLEGKNREYNVGRYDAETELTGAWSWDDFKVAGWTKDAREFLKEIAKAAEQSDLTIWTGNTVAENKNPFSRAGLIIGIVSKMPQEGKEQINNDDAERQRLVEAAEATGIRKKIEDNVDKLRDYQFGPAFHALAPGWIGEFVRKDDNYKLADTTKHPVMFFLNPASRKYEAGWYTVEELEEWIEGRGRVIKKTENA